MTLVRLTENRAQRPVEKRAGLGPGGSYIDPSAVPPPGLWNQQRAGVIVTQQSLLQVDVVFTALRIITTAVLKMGDPRAYTEDVNKDNLPFRRFKSKQPAILTDTWGGRMMQYDGRRRTLMSMGLFGEAFWYVIERDRLAYPSALDVLHPAFMEVKRDEKTGRTVYLYGSGSDRKELDPDDIIHIPFMALPQARRALNHVEFSSVAGALAMAAYEFGCSWFAQGAAPSFILSTDQKLGQAEVIRIAEKFSIEHAGLVNSHLPLVLDGGMKADKVLSAPNESQYIETLNYARNVIAGWFGIPLSMLGHALGSQPTVQPHTAEEETSRFLKYTLAGYTIPLEEAYSQLIPGSSRVAFDDTQLIRPDAQSLAMLVSSLRQAQVASPDELRTRFLGWAPTDDGSGTAYVQPLASNVSPSQTEPSAPKVAA